LRHLNNAFVSLFLTVTPIIFEDIALLSGLPISAHCINVPFNQTKPIYGIPFICVLDANFSGDHAGLSIFAAHDSFKDLKLKRLGLKTSSPSTILSIISKYYLCLAANLQ
jgi:hypothetical protein